MQVPRGEYASIRVIRERVFDLFSGRCHTSDEVLDQETAREVGWLGLDLAWQNLPGPQATISKAAPVARPRGAGLKENNKWLSALDTNYKRQQAQLGLPRWRAFFFGGK